MTTFPPPPPPRPLKSKPSLINGFMQDQFEKRIEQTNCSSVPTAISSSHNQFKVAIIGAGMAGLSAANHLIENGIKDIVVIEARDRTGGRIHTIKHNGRPLELGAQWIHGGCPANSVFNLANKFKLLGVEVQRLHEDTEENDGENPLRRWPTTKGYIYKPDGLPMACDASSYAYDAFNSIVDEAERHHKGPYQKHLKRSQNRLISYNHNSSPSYISSHLQSTRLSTFYNGRKRKALEAIRKSIESNNTSSNNGSHCSSSQILSDVDLALSGFSRVFSVECGEDLTKVRLEILGSNEGKTSGIPGGNVIVPYGVGEITNRLSNLLPNGSIRLDHRVTSIDWSLLSRNPRLPDKITIECSIGKAKAFSSIKSKTSSNGFEKGTNNLVNSTKVIINADYVICTLPLGVLKVSHRKMFYPRLPEPKARSIENIGYGKVGKLFLEWSQPWWALGEGGIQLAWPESSYIPNSSPPSMRRSFSHSNIPISKSHCQNNSSNKRPYSDNWEDEIQCLETNGFEEVDNESRNSVHQIVDDRLRYWYRGISNFSEVENQPNLLLCWIAGESAKIADQLDDEEIIQTVTDVLRKFTGDPGLNPPDKVYRHLWCNDQFSLGTTSYPSLITEDDDFENLGHPLPCETDPRLLFAGEATHPKFWGQMLGARLSGIREAQRIIDRIHEVKQIDREMNKITSNLSKSEPSKWR